MNVALDTVGLYAHDQRDKAEEHPSCSGLPLLEIRIFHTHGHSRFHLKVPLPCSALLLENCSDRRRSLPHDWPDTRFLGDDDLQKPDSIAQPPASN